ncbi:hypothetical protein ACRW3C_27620, partial [Escherichia coli]
ERETTGVVGKAERLTWHKAWTMVSTGFSISYTSRRSRNRGGLVDLKRVPAFVGTQTIPWLVVAGNAPRCFIALKVACRGVISWRSAERGLMLPLPG